MTTLARPAAAARVASLLGHAQVEMALLCLGSLRRFCGGALELRLHDDGTLTAEDQARLATLGDPEIVPRQRADDEVEPALGGRPRLRALRRRNPLALKLLDAVWLGGDELLYCDSDVLFLRPFADLFQRRLAGVAAVFMTDRQNAYSLRSWQLLRHPRRLRLVRQLNSGVVRFPRAALDLDLLEWLVGQLSIAPVWMEQTCWAVLASRLSCRLLDPRQVLIPEPGGVPPAGCVAAHFVGPVRGELGRWAGVRVPAEESAVEVRSLPARRCRPLDLATSEARRVIARFHAAR